MKTIITILIILITMQSCVINKGLKNKNAISKELCLIKMIPGGSRAHIFIVSTQGELTYCIGSIYDFEEGKFNINEKYKSKNAMFKPKEMEVLEVSCFKILEGTFYKGSIVLKDSWQYCLYVDGLKKGFWYSNNKEEIPKEFKNIIDIIEHKLRLYKLPGTS